MCKNARVREDVIRRLKSEGNELVIAVYEDRDVRDLTSVILVNGPRAESYKVDRYGDTTSMKVVRRLYDVSMRGIRRAFDVDGKYEHLHVEQDLLMRFAY